ncbi:MAG: hypothetical protein ACOC4G_04400 [Bacillota bacterium]
MDGLDNIGTNLLEPIVDFKIKVPEAVAGRILNDITEMRGEYDSPEIEDGKFVVEGTVPVATSMDYPLKLTSISGGRGIMQSKFAGYKICSVESGEKCPRRGVNPLDQSRYILSVRNALDK